MSGAPAEMVPLLRRVEALGRAITARDWQDVEFIYGQVSSAAQRLAGTRQRHYDPPATADAPAGPECGAVRYASDKPCAGPAKFTVLYRSPETRRVFDPHPACFVHGLAEVDRHHAAGGIAVVDMVETPADPAT